MTHKQRKALARHKAYEKARNVRKNNWPKGLTADNVFTPRRHAYRFWEM